MAKKIKSIRQNLDADERLESTSWLDDEDNETARFDIDGNQTHGEGLGPKVVDGVREMGKSSHGGRGDIPDRFQDTQGNYVTKTVTYPRNEEGNYNKVENPNRPGELIVDKRVTWKTRDGKSVDSEDVTPEFINQPRDLDLSPLGKEATGGYGVPSNTSNSRTRHRQNIPNIATPPAAWTTNMTSVASRAAFSDQDTGQQINPQESGMTLAEIQRQFRAGTRTDRDAKDEQCIAWSSRVQRRPHIWT